MSTRRVRFLSCLPASCVHVAMPSVYSALAAHYTYAFIRHITLLNIGSRHIMYDAIHFFFHYHYYFPPLIITYHHIHTHTQATYKDTSYIYIHTHTLLHYTWIILSLDYSSSLLSYISFFLSFRHCSSSAFHVRFPPAFRYFHVQR